MMFNSHGCLHKGFSTGHSRLNLPLIMLLFFAGQVIGAGSAEQMKTFGTMGKAVYPFVEGSRTEAYDVRVDLRMVNSSMNDKK